MGFYKKYDTKISKYSFCLVKSIFFCVYGMIKGVKMAFLMFNICNVTKYSMEILKLSIDERHIFFLQKKWRPAMNNSVVNKKK